MSQNGAPPAGRQGKPKEWDPVAASPAKCTLQFALSAARTRKYLSSPARADPFIAANASAKCGPVVKTLLNSTKNNRPAKIKLAGLFIFGEKSRCYTGEKPITQ
jgi:hypothetical protein